MKEERIVCGYVNSRDKVCRTPVREDGMRCFAHSEAGEKARANMVLSYEAKLIAEESARVVEARSETARLVALERNERHKVEFERRELERITESLKEARREHDALMASFDHARLSARIAALLERAEELALRHDASAALLAQAEACRDTARELRLAATFAKQVPDKQPKHRVGKHNVISDLLDGPDPLDC